MSDLDYSLPLADLLRLGTTKAHQDAENSQGGIALANGKLAREEYVRFLMMMFYVYE
jgi:heme oxygenase